MYLRRLNLHGNFLSGRIPERLSNASSLHSINLYSNNFSGELPAGLCSLPSLQNLDVSRNSISGKLPPAFGSCNKLQRLVLSNNELTGEVPAEVWPEMENLVELDLSGNRLSGRIPAELGMMKLMTGTLNLSHNAFEGEIPVELGKLPAEVSIDLRGNHLSGEIPSVGALENRAPEFFLGNPGLCGDPLPIRCESSPTGNAIENLDKTRGKGLSTRWIVLISALDAVVVAVIGILLFCFFWKVIINNTQHKFSDSSLHSTKKKSETSNPLRVEKIGGPSIVGTNSTIVVANLRTDRPSVVVHSEQTRNPPIQTPTRHPYRSPYRTQTRSKQTQIPTLNWNH